MTDTASDRIRAIEQDVYALAREVDASDGQLERIDRAMAELFAILDLDVPIEV